jgi:RNA polymerase sigma-70 factor, ECF subfamily
MLRLLKTAPDVDALDAHLVIAAIEGDSQAFRVLFERHVVSVRRFLFDMLRNAHCADDATQETFTRAHASLRKSQGIPFKAWLMGIGRNVAFENRRLKVHATIEDDDFYLPAAVIPSPDPQDIVLSRELEGQFNEALKALSPLRRAAFLMKVDHGLRYEEIAQALGMSLQTVKNEIHRARLKLRTLLLPHLGGSYE